MSLKIYNYYFDQASSVTMSLATKHNIYLINNTIAVFIDMMFQQES